MYKISWQSIQQLLRVFLNQVAQILIANLLLQFIANNYEDDES